jgi:hypothetical protein
MPVTQRLANPKLLTSSRVAKRNAIFENNR